MDLLTLCRAKVDGIEFKIVRVCWTGRGGGYTYRVYRNRRKFVKDEFPTIGIALAFMEGALEVRIEELEKRSRQ